MKSRKDDYLKYWRVIRQFTKVKYGLTQSDLDIIFFLYSEKYFDKDKFGEFDNLLGWDKQRFEKLRQSGWIESFRHGMTPGGRRAIYQLSTKAIGMVRSVYKKLNGEEIPVSQSQNKMFARNVSYTDKVYRNMIKEMNAIIKQQRHRAPEQ
jgi:hypothetical protein